MSEKHVTAIVTAIRNGATEGAGPHQDMLTPGGIEHARRVGAARFRAKLFSDIVCSYATRTMQTLAAIIEGAGDFTTPNFEIDPEWGLTSASVEGWLEAIRRAGSQDTSALLAANEDNPFVNTELARRGHAMVNTVVRARSRPDRIWAFPRILIVTHSPLIEAATYFLAGATIRRLGPLEGVNLTFYADGTVQLVNEIRL